MAVLIALAGLTLAPPAGAVDLKTRVAAVVGSYLGDLAAHPSAAHSRSAAEKADAQLARAARRARGDCRVTVGRTRRAIRDLSLGAEAKRDRVLDAAVHVYVSC